MKGRGTTRRCRAAALLVAGTCFAAPAGAAPAGAAPATGRLVPEQAREARELEDVGAYARAALHLRALRGRVAPDADLEIALALLEARTGAADSAVARLASPLVAAAARETLPLTRRREYPYAREGAWINGRFDGWHWYIWRARAELAAAQGRWREALEAARECVNARPLTGKEWLILAVSAARAGEPEESRRAVRRARFLDPTLPEASYLEGLWEWRSGHRGEAAERFRSAVALDSTYRPAALALIRSRLPGAAPDTFPGELLTGLRQAALLTSPERPKPEEFVQMDVPATLVSAPDTAVTDPLETGVKPLLLVISVLVDEQGRAVLNEIPWFSPGQIEASKIVRILASSPAWRFSPAIRLGRPERVWVSMEYHLNP